MTDFDPDKYFSNKLASVDIKSKIESLGQASSNKIAELQANRAAAIAHDAQVAAANAAKDASWVNKLGAEEGSFLGNRINDVASLASGTTRLAGHIASLPVNALAAGVTLPATPEDYNAYNKLKTGNATAEDMALLNREVTPGRTIKSTFTDAEKLRATAHKINSTLDISSVVNSTNRDSLSKDLGDDFQARWDKVTGGFEATKKGEFLNGTKDMVVGMAGLLANTGAAVLQNPSAAREYIVENAPQLLVGGLGKAGQAAMAMSNMGYAADNYEQGLTNYAKQNNGQLPPEDQRHRMAVLAASLAIAEHAGDHLGLAFGKKAVQAAGDVAEVTAKQSLLNTLKAAGSGFGTEAATEGYQTYAEGEVQGKPASAKDIYIGTVIGGVAGAGLSGGMRGVTEVAGVTPEQLQVKADALSKDKATAEQFKEAAASGDPSIFLDPKTKLYDPAKAIGVLLQNANRNDVTPEARKENLNKASTLIDKMETDLAAAQQDVEMHSPEYVAQIKEQMKAKKAELDATDRTDVAAVKQMKQDIGDLQAIVAEASDSKGTKAAKQAVETLQRQLRAGRTLTEQLASVAEPMPETSEVESLVQQVQDKAPEQAQATDRIINLSMVQPDSLSAEQASALADNKSNSLSEEQRTHLRAFSAARVIENQLSTMEKVSQEVLTGTQKNVGIAQWRARIGSALAAGNESTAARGLQSLEQFATSHAEKFALANEVFSAGNEAQIIRNANGTWEINTGDLLDDKELKKNGGLNIHPIRSKKLVPAIGVEAQAIAATAAEMKSAISLKFGVQSVSQEKTDVLPGNSNDPMNEEESARPDVPSEPVVAEASPSVPKEEKAPIPARQPKVVDHAKQKFASEPEAREYVRKNKLGATHRVFNSNRNEYVLRLKPESKTTPITPTASPSSEPASAVVADAPSATAPTSATAETQSPLEQVQAETGKAEVQERVSEANTSPAPEAAPVEALVETTENTDYKNKKLGDFFSLVSGDQNPLVSVRDFLSNLKRVSQFQDYIGDKLTQDQVNTLKGFRALALTWAPKITANLFERGTPEYNYNDMMQFFIKDGDIDENVKTALIYAAYSYVAENAGRSKWNTDEQINKMLGRQKEDNVSREERALMRTALGRQTLLINGLGKRAMQALGMQAKTGTPVNVVSQMQSALGAHAMRLLTDGENSIIKRKPLPQDVVTAMMNRTDDNQEVEENEEVVETGESTEEAGTKAKPVKRELKLKEIFLEFRRDETGILTPEALNIQNINRNSQSVVSKLFGIEDVRIPPSLKPVGKVKEFVKRGKQRVPSALKKVLGSLNKQANFIRQEKVALVSALGRENFLTMMGKKELDPTAIHANNMDGVEANNDGLERELANIEEFINLTLLPSDKGMDQAFFFEHYSMSQQRVGITNKLVNPQLSKLQRFMIYRASWESTIDTTNEKQMANFWLRVAEGMGVKTEQFLSDVSIDKLQVTYNSKLVQDAIAAINAGLAGETLTSEQQKAVVDAVAKGGEKAHSLDALTALAAYAKLLEAGPSNGTFKVNMLAEVDGVTNGPMLSHLLLGAASSVADLYKMLNRGGFYAMGKGIKEFNVWRSQLDSKDLYQQTTANVLNLLRSQINARTVSAPLVSAVTYFLGDIASRDDKGDLTVKSAGRKMIKTPLTAVTYGSALDKAVDESMFDDFIDNIYAKIETISKMDQLQPNEAAAESIKLKTNLEKMGVGFDEGMTIKDMMDRSLTSAELKTLKQVFTETFGQAVKKTIETDFKALLETRTKFNRSMKNVWSLADSIYNSMYEEYKAELVASGEMATNAVGDAIHDLTPAQQATLNERLAKVMPSLQTAMSLQEAPNADTGLKVGKSELSMSIDLAYKNEVKFGKPYDDTVNNPDYNKPVIAIRTSGERVITKDPGVGLGATSTHSFDSAIMHTSIEAGDEVLGLHDAKGVGAHQVQEAGQKLNKATWDQAMNYSPTQEAYNTFIRTMTGIDALINDPATPASVVTDLLARVNGMATRKIPAGSVLIRMAIDMQALAHQTDSIKFGAMATMETVAQYAVEGGAYEVTPEDRAAAQAKLKALSATPSAADVALINKIMDKLNEANKAKPAEKVTSEIAEVGTPSVKANIKIEAAMKAKPVMSLGDVISMLKQNVTGDFNKTLLGALERSVASDITVRYITAATPMTDVMELPGKNSSGWYVSKDGKHEIYILSSEFKDAAVTQEVILHELLHGALARIIETNDAQTAPFIGELNGLLAQAQAYVQKEGLEDKYGPAVVDIHELVSWGMTNDGFQKSVLSKIKSASTTDSSMFSTAYKAFVDALVGLVFKRKNVNMSNGMAVLINNVSGLLNFAENKVTVVTTNTINLAQTNTNNGLQDLTTVDIFDAISDTHNGASVSSEFSTKLQSLLNSIVDKLHGPVGAYKAAIMQQTAQTAEQVYQDAMNSGIAPFAADITQSGLAFTEQEAFVADQVQATVREATSGKDGMMSVAYRELSKLYDEVRTKMKVSDLYLTANPTSVEKAEAQALYDFMFNVDTKADGTSEYLSRFAALGLANERINTLFETMVSTKASTTAATSFNDRLFKIFNTILDWFSGKMTNTYNNQKVDAKLESLVTQLVKIEARKKALLAAKAKVVQPAESMVDTLSAAARAKLEEFMKKPFFRQNNNAFIRGGSALVSAYANDKVDAILDGVTRLRDKHFQGQNGIAAGLVNEFRGSNDSNVMFHFLLRATKYIEGIRKDIITGTSNLVRSSFVNGGKDLTNDQKSAITAVFLRTDMASLLPEYNNNMAEIRELINDPQKVFDEIARIEAKLTGPMKRFYVNSAKALAYYKAMGVVTNDHLLMNAGNIARAYGTQQQNRVTEAQAKAAEAIIDPLVSLYALSYTRDSHMVNAKAVINAEAVRTDGGNGVEMILKAHAMLQQQSKDLLFDGSEALAMKGYLPEMFDPYLDVVMANDHDGADLIARGYDVLPDPVKADITDVTYEPRRIYYLRDGGLKSWNSGIFSTTGTNAKGSRIHDGNVSSVSAAGNMNAQAMAQITAAKRAGTNIMFTSTTFNPVAVHESNQKFLAPVLNANGDVVNYRYLMTEEMKDNLLKRDNRTERVLGQLAGSIYDKVKSKDQNKRGVGALHEQFKEEFAERPEAYMEVGPKSTDPQLREIWRLLPAATKADVRAIWGTEKMMVRRDLLDMNFGYRKLSIADGFNKDAAERSFIEGMFVDIMSNMFDRKAALRTRQAEDIWQAVVKATKANLVVKSWSTMSGNLRSNFSQLLLMGVNPIAIGRSHRVAFKGAWAFKKDSEELFSLKQQLASGYLQPGMTTGEAENRIKRLQDSINRNPVKPLIDAGLMPTIVEDVAVDDDIYSYKSKFVKETEKFTRHLNPNVVNVGKFLLMTEDSSPYKVMSYATQISDFLARYTVYEHVTTRTKNKLSHEAAVQLASDAFINYDVPTHRKVQYANDSGLVMFTKYYIRIQKMLVQIYKTNPGRVIALIAAEKMLLGDQPTVLDSSMVTRWGNPMNLGALDYPGSLDALTTVRILTSPFSGGGNPAE